MTRVYFLQFGFITLELLIAFAILILNITAISLVLNSGQAIYLNSEINLLALVKAKNELEQIRVDAEFDFNLINPSTFSETNAPFFTQKIEVFQSDLFTKEVTSIIEWPIWGGKISKVELKTLLTNKEALEGGDTCSSVLIGDWTNPEIISYELGTEILEDSTSGFPISSFQSFNKKIYLTVSNEKENNSGTFFILDISNQGEKPILLGSLDNSPSVSEGLKAVVIDGKNYAYVANAYRGSSEDCIEDNNCAQLQIINIENPNSPFLARNFKIKSVTTSGKLAYGNSIFYQNGIIYLGLAKSENSEFYIIDVGGGGTDGASPLNPIILGSYEVGNGVNALLKKGKYVYLASPNSQELKILNVDDLNNPLLAGSFNSNFGAGHGKSIFLVGNQLFLGKTVPNFGNDFHIIDNLNPGNTLEELGGINIESSVNGIIVRDYLAFLINKSDFQILRIDQPSNISSFSEPLSLPPGFGQVEGTAIDCENNYIFISSQKIAENDDDQDKGYFSIINAP